VGAHLERRRALRADVLSDGLHDRAAVPAALMPGVHEQPPEQVAGLLEGVPQHHEAHQLVSVVRRSGPCLRMRLRVGQGLLHGLDEGLLSRSHPQRDHIHVVVGGQNNYRDAVPQRIDCLRRSAADRVTYRCENH